MLSEHTQKPGNCVIGNRAYHYIVIMSRLLSIYVTICHDEARPLFIWRVENLYLQAVP